MIYKKNSIADISDYKKIFFLEIKETPATFCQQNGINGNNFTKKKRVNRDILPKKRINEGWDPYYPGIFYASAIKEFFCLEGWNLFYLGKKAELRKFRDSFSFFDPC